MTSPLITPTDALLSCHIFENEHIGLAQTLFYTIEIGVEPTEYQGEKEDSDVSLNFIVFPDLHGYKNMPGKTFRFPINPEDGHIDGSFCYGHAHNPCDISQITFGEITGDMIAVRLIGKIDFTYEGPEELGIRDIDWSLKLKLHTESLDRYEMEAKSLNIL